MTVPFIRFKGVAARLRVTVPQTGLALSNLDGSGLRMDWSIQLSNTNTPGQAKIEIWNLSSKLKKLFDQLYSETFFNFSIGFDLGWDSQVQTVFEGEVWEVSNKKTRTGPVTTLMCGEGSDSYRDAFLSANFAEVGVKGLLKTLVSGAPPEGLNLKIDAATFAIITEAVTTSLVGTLDNIVVDGNTVDAVNDIMESIGLTWFAQHGFFVVLRNGIRQSLVIPVLSPSTGLLVPKELAAQGVQAKCLARGDCLPGQQVALLDSKGRTIVAKAFRVDSTQFQGSTRGTSTMDLTCRRASLI